MSDDFDLLIDLHREGQRQGPGGSAETRLAMRLAGLDKSRRLKIAEIGCGTGAAALELAANLNAAITAVDFLAPFLQDLEKRAAEAGVLEDITILEASMDALPFEEESFDVIWSEGAVYNMGFEAGVSAWQRFLKPGGKLVVSEITWLSAARPEEINTHWTTEYPEIDLASAKMAVLERAGYRPLGYFVLPRHCWLENYYRPMEGRFERFLARHDQSEAAKTIVQAERHEIALYEQYGAYFSYGMYVAEKGERG